MNTKINVKELRNQMEISIISELQTLLEGHQEIPKDVYVVSTVQDPASEVYMRNKMKAIAKVGLNPIKKEFWENPLDTLQFVKDIVEGKISCLGLIVQKPLADALKPYERKIDNMIPRSKDIDQISLNYDEVYLEKIKEKMYPCTVWGSLEVISRLCPSLSGKTVLVIGRSEIVGKPLAVALIEKQATVISANSRTPKETMQEMFRRADIIVSAVGRPRIWGEEYLTSGKILIDVGINRVDGKLCGDFDISEETTFVEDISYTPVPGGIGLMTVLGVQKNLLELAKLYL